MREGVIEQTVQLTKERMTVGRHKHNDIVLNHAAVSGEHAIVTTILDDSFLEDLQSTNGTFVNGHRIGKHFLQNKDVIKMAKYHLEFVSDGIRPLAAAAATIPAMPVPPSASVSASSLLRSSSPCRTLCPGTGAAWPRVPASSSEPLAARSLSRSLAPSSTLACTPRSDQPRT